MKPHSPDTNQRNLPLFIASVLLFFLCFAVTQRADWPLIAAKDLHAHDESSNSTVAANLTRRIFPPMLRVNPLVDRQSQWMENPYWQHVPPLFTYVPLPLFAIDGKVTIEIKRLAYALVLLLAGAAFIACAFLFDPGPLSAPAAALAAIVWIRTPFTRNLIDGKAFGASDAVLAAMVVASLCGLCWYLSCRSSERVAWPLWKLLCVGAIVALPVVAKNILGAIPAATFALILLRDRRKPDLGSLAAGAGFLLVLIAFFLPLALNSPESFRRESLVPFSHFDDFEGWGMPWHAFLTNYLPNDYLRTAGFLICPAALFTAVLLARGRFSGRTRSLLNLCGGWFVWNLVAVSLVRSKAPNFIFQSYLLGLFFAVYGPVWWLFTWLQAKAATSGVLLNRRLLSLSTKAVPWVAGLLLVLTCVASYRLWETIHSTRTRPYRYSSRHELYYWFAEQEQSRGANPANLFVLDTSSEDCWFRYYLLFLTGAEARTLDEIIAYKVPAAAIAAKYSEIDFVLSASDSPPDLAPLRSMYDRNGLRIAAFDAHLLRPDYIAAVQSWVLAASGRRAFASASACPWLFR